MQENYTSLGTAVDKMYFKGHNHSNCNPYHLKELNKVLRIFLPLLNGPGYCDNYCIFDAFDTQIHKFLAG